MLTVTYQEEQDEEGVYLGFAYFILLRFQLPRQYIVGVLDYHKNYLPGEVVEVAQEPPLDPIHSIHDGTLGCSSASQSKVSLHCGCSRIQNADHICILGPNHSEMLLQMLW